MQSSKFYNSYLDSNRARAWVRETEFQKAKHASSIAIWVLIHFLQCYRARQVPASWEVAPVNKRAVPRPHQEALRCLLSIGLLLFFNRKPKKKRKTEKRWIAHKNVGTISVCLLLFLNRKTEKPINR
jgi:hypothetical protein